MTCYTDTILANSEFNFKYPLNPLNKCSKKVKFQVVESIWSNRVCMVHSVMKGNFSVFQGGVPEIHYRSLVDIENEVSWFKSPKSRRLYRITKVLGIGRLCPQWAVIFINSSLMKSIQ